MERTYVAVWYSLWLIAHTHTHTTSMAAFSRSLLMVTGWQLLVVNCPRFSIFSGEFIRWWIVHAPSLWVKLATFVFPFSHTVPVKLLQWTCQHAFSARWSSHIHSLFYVQYSHDQIRSFLIPTICAVNSYIVCKKKRRQFWNNHNFHMHVLSKMFLRCVQWWTGQKHVHVSIYTHTYIYIFMYALLNKCGTCQSLTWLTMSVCGTNIKSPVIADCMCETHRERERERDTHTHTHKHCERERHTHTHTNTEIFCSIFVQLMFFML